MENEMSNTKDTNKKVKKKTASFAANKLSAEMINPQNSVYDKKDLKGSDWQDHRKEPQKKSTLLGQIASVGRKILGIDKKKATISGNKAGVGIKVKNFIDDFSIKPENTYNPNAPRFATDKELSTMKNHSVPSAAERLLKSRAELEKENRSLRTEAAVEAFSNTITDLKTAIEKDQAFLAERAKLEISGLYTDCKSKNELHDMANKVNEIMNVVAPMKEISGKDHIKTLPYSPEQIAILSLLEEPNQKMLKAQEAKLNKREEQQNRPIRRVVTRGDHARGGGGRGTGA